MLIALPTRRADGASEACLWWWCVTRSFRVAAWLSATGAVERRPTARAPLARARSAREWIVGMRRFPSHACEVSCRVRARRCPATGRWLHPERPRDAGAAAKVGPPLLPSVIGPRPGWQDLACPGRCCDLKPDKDGNQKIRPITSRCRADSVANAPLPAWDRGRTG